MAYGILLSNANGETVVDDTYPAMMLDSSSTLTGSSPRGGFYTYPLDSAKVQFFNLAVGQTLLAVRAIVATNTTNYNHYVDAATVPVRYAKAANEFPAANGYGISVHNSAGQTCYDSSNSIIPVLDYFEIPKGTSLINCPSNWVAIVDHPLYNVVDDNSGFGISIATGIKRVSSTQYQYAEKQVSQGFPAEYFANTPVRFLGAT